MAVGELPTDQREPRDQGAGVLGEELLEVLLDAVLLQPGVDAEVVQAVVDDLLDQDPQGVGVAPLGAFGGDGPLDLAVLGAAPRGPSTAATSSSGL